MIDWKKNDWQQSDIEYIISNKYEESINIEFKRGNALVNTEKTKKEIAKDVSAFANSKGGIIVYGIWEQEHVAASVSFIDGKIITKEWLEQVINSTIQKRIEGLSIYPIRFDNDLQKSIYIVSIPESQNKPHISIDKRFYKRQNFESIAMEEYEISDLYNRVDNKIEIVEVKTSGISHVRHKDDSWFQFLGMFNSYWNFYINIRNTGIHSTDSYKIIVTVNKKKNSHIPILVEPNINSTIMGDTLRISPNHTQKILSREVITGIAFQASAYGIHHSKPDNTSIPDFEVSLYYSGGEENFSYSFREVILRSGCQP